ncbi:MAG: beta-N-acetylhexosaminidase [Acidobacteriaceae bacterium]
MPMPRHVAAGSGELAIHSGFTIRVQSTPNDDLVSSAAERCRHSLQQGTALTIRITQGPATSRDRANSLSIVVRAPAQAQIGADESYSLHIDAKSARLEAATSLGALHGLATFRQLIQRRGPRVFVPAVDIVDAPVYPWRGLMIDVARHFMPVDVIRRNLDAMELVKLNVLHLHLSDNEGFRIESKVFPRLQADGSDGQYYTQAEMRDLIHYADLRGIVIVPEFDMPSHSMSWFAGYPELSSSPGPFKPGIFRIAGISAKSTPAQLMVAYQTAKVPAFDPSRESTYAFLDKFIAEMAALFPSPYFHIGADENNGAIWLANPSIVAFMHAHQLADAPALQAYFVRRVQQLVVNHGKRMVAWEEAYAPGQFKDSIFQVWSPLAKVDLTKVPMTDGNQILISRGFYLDLFYPAHVHYLNDALPDNRSANPAVLGGEAAMWAELADPTNLEARVWPRTGAIAERLWSGAPSPDLADFYRRLFRLSALLDREGVHNLSDYTVQVHRLAGTRPTEPVSTLLNVLTPVKGYHRLMAYGFRRLAGGPLPTGFNRVADVVLVDSATKYQFRDALASYLKTRDRAQEADLRVWLKRWSKNDAALRPYFAQSADLAEVAGNSKNLAALARAGLQALDQFDRGSALNPDQLAADDALIKSAQAGAGETQIAVLPEIQALIHQNLVPEPTSYPLF